MVDEFQHIVYADPDMTPGERNEMGPAGKRVPPLAGLRGLPFYGRGAGWQRQLHIYEVPFYYSITAWPRRWRCSSSPRFCTTRRTPGGGIWPWWTRPAASYPGLVAAAGLDSPFAPGTLAKLGKEVGTMDRGAGRRAERPVKDPAPEWTGQKRPGKGRAEQEA